MYPPNYGACMISNIRVCMMKEQLCVVVRVCAACVRGRIKREDGYLPSSLHDVRMYVGSYSR